jgi:hypothetical protein
MPYPRTDPVSEHELFHGEHPGHHTICQNNRDLYREIQKLAIPDWKKDELLEMIRLNYAFGKRMHRKLRKYRWIHDNPEKFRSYEEEI